MNETDGKMSSRSRNLITLAVMIAIAIVIYFGYRYNYASTTADEATNFAETFIRNSPIVNSHLGTVTTVKQTHEQYISGDTPKVQLAFDVGGAKGDAVVTVHLDRVNNNTWSMPAAEMRIGQKDVDLR